MKLYNIHRTSCGTKIFFNRHFHQRHYSSLCWPKSNTDPWIYIFQYCLGILPTEVLTHNSLSRQLFYIYSVSHQRISTTQLSQSLHTNFISYPLSWSWGRCGMASHSSAQMSKEISITWAVRQHFEGLSHVDVLNIRVPDVTMVFPV